MTLHCQQEQLYRFLFRTNPQREDYLRLGWSQTSSMIRKKIQKLFTLPNKA